MARPIGTEDMDGVVAGPPSSILTALRSSDHSYGSKVYAVPTAGVGILQVAYFRTSLFRVCVMHSAHML